MLLFAAKRYGGKMKTLYQKTSIVRSDSKWRSTRANQASMTVMDVYSQTQTMHGLIY